MGRKNKPKRRIYKKMNIEDLMSQTAKKNKKVKTKNQKNCKIEEKNFREELKFENFCKRKDSQQAEEERQIVYLKAIGKLHEQDEGR